LPEKFGSGTSSCRTYPSLAIGAGLRFNRVAAALQRHIRALARIERLSHIKRAEFAPYRIVAEIDRQQIRMGNIDRIGPGALLDGYVSIVIDD